MNCSNCGTPLKEDNRFCPECGNMVNNNINTSNTNNGNSFVWGLLGFFVPLAGLILFIMWNNTRKNDAKAAGIGALISTILNVLCVFLYLIVIIIMFS